MLKFVDPSVLESAICLALTGIADPHTILFQHLAIPLLDDPSAEIFVTDRMRDANDPPFETVGEVLEFLQQPFKHIVISLRNMVMDTTTMIPGGYHPINTLTEDGLSKSISVRSRTSAGPISYYFINFGLAVAYKSYDARGK
ncbi:hypothetical protein DFH09DRAFT_1390770 [Mycena vulgaris]|nr:hypothetical protein DFH09DRAFT_1390770 [Mycena vulgaris]